MSGSGEEKVVVLRQEEIAALFSQGDGQDDSEYMC